jgi:hypothetical protein
MCFGPGPRWACAPRDSPLRCTGRTPPFLLTDPSICGGRLCRGFCCAAGMAPDCAFCAPDNAAAPWWTFALPGYGFGAAAGKCAACPPGSAPTPNGLGCAAAKPAGARCSATSECQSGDCRGGVCCGEGIDFATCGVCGEPDVAPGVGGCAACIPGFQFDVEGVCVEGGVDGFVCGGVPPEGSKTVCIGAMRA